jgi:predicted Zn finger-like uncharacterized protein
MFVSCNSCNKKLQLDDDKVPARAFTVRCPNCQMIINVSAPDKQPGAVGIGLNPSTDAMRNRIPRPAPLYKGAGNQGGENKKAISEEAKAGNANYDVLQLLAEYLQGGGKPSGSSKNSKLDWERKRVLVCATPAHRDLVAETLANGGYRVYVAEDTMQALDRFREERIEVVILDTEFDKAEQGVAFVTNEVNGLRPADRRRLIFVQLSPVVRTGDSHAAFVNNVNLVVHPAEVDQLNLVLERTMRDLTELYRDYTAALTVKSF